MKTIFWIIVVILLIYGSYYFYQNYSKPPVEIPSLGNLTSTSTLNFAFSKTKDLASSTFDFLTDKSKTALSKAVDYFAPAVNELINQSKDFLASSTISAENKAILMFNKNFLGITSTSQIISQTPNLTGNVQAQPLQTNISIADNIGQNISFIIQAINARSYQVDWGDGEKESGILSQRQNTVISHTWTNKGNYSVAITLDNNQKTIFPVTIY